MRNFRTAAVASATAFAVAFGGTTLAAAEDDQPANTPAVEQPADTKQGSAENESSADGRDRQVVLRGKQDGDKDFGAVLSDGTKGLFSGQGSSQYFDDSKKPFFITDAFGKETNIDQVPQWARWWIDSTDRKSVV